MIKSNPALQKKLLLALKKSQGTLTKVTQMIENDCYCGDIAQQINASIGLLRGVNEELMKNHLLCCGRSDLAAKDSKKGEKFVEEFTRIWQVSKR
ncbi:metal-sensing transcriptional repressor [Candidatus Gracilibacteria bacterium]|jgi:DNA-binding FrmR family transcriptional regulator|nr:metal-sensing transcriptional repressor [Candidatus Gracilibacteria bacterium]